MNYTDNNGHFIQKTKERNGMDYGILVNTNTNAVSWEQPIATIENHMHGSEWVEIPELPPEAQAIIARGLPENPSPAELS